MLSKPIFWILSTYDRTVQFALKSQTTTPSR